VECAHDWDRMPGIERGLNGPHCFLCAKCGMWGWRPRWRISSTADPDPIRIYCPRRQATMHQRALVRSTTQEITARPMSARRARNGGYVPPGSGGR